MRTEDPGLASIPIATLSGISPSDVVALNRVGIISVSDLLGSDFDRVAYLLDSYDNAEILFREAMSFAKQFKGTSPRTASVKPAEDGPHEAAPASASAGEVVSLALSEAARLENVEGDAVGALARLARRTELAASLGDRTPEVLAAALLHDAAERPDWPARRGELASKFGAGFGAIVEQCASLRVVPLSPAGGPGKSYLALMEGASAPARLVCAGVTIRSIRDALEGVARSGPSHWKSHPGGLECALWYYRLVSSALRATESGHPLVDSLSALVVELEQACGRAAAA